MTDAPKPLPAGRARKVASRNLGIALQAAHRRLIEAEGNDAVQLAAIELGQLFNANIEFICWTLKEYGGVNQMPAERLYARRELPMASNDGPALTAVRSGNITLPKLSSTLTGALDLEPILPCICEPLEAGIIGRAKHMTSCPQFRP